MKIILIAAAVTIAAYAGAAHGAEHEVLMLNKGAKGAMVFEPDFIAAQPGDTIRFVPADKGHSAETVKGMLPEGAAEAKGKLNEEIVVEIDREGVWGFKCPPHYGMGMVALVVAGAPANLEAAMAVKQTGKAKKVFAELFEQAAKVQ